MDESVEGLVKGLIALVLVFGTLLGLSMFFGAKHAPHVIHTL